MTSLSSRWIQFTSERFPLGSHMAMICLFCLSHQALLKEAIDYQSIIIILIVTSFFFRLRLFDELKDYQTDIIQNPDRPLPRGLLSEKDLKKALPILVIFELILMAIISIYGIIFMLITTLYSFLMYNEFFLSRHLNNKLTTYAITHTFVTVLLSLTLFSALHSSFHLQLDFVLFSLSTWPLFNIFEFTRKTFASSEEKSVQTYSNVWGKKGAIALSISQAFIHLYLISFISSIGLFKIIILSTPLFFMSLFAIAYLIHDSIQSAKIYRLFSALYIVLFFMLFLATTFYLS